MSIPHTCIGNPCLICNPNQRIAGTSGEPVIDCNPWRTDPKDAEASIIVIDWQQWRAANDECRTLKTRVAALEAGIGEMLQAFDGTDVALQARCLDNLRALLAPPEGHAAISEFHPATNAELGVTVEAKPCATCGGSGKIPMPEGW